VVSDEGVPVLTATARRAYVPHVLLDRAFADADAELQELAADPLRALQRVVFGHRLDEQEQAVIAVDPRSPDTATEHDHLLAEQRIFGQELRSCAG
jgi:hypothetical protein